MGLNKADLILHPARLQILQALAVRPMNTQDLADRLAGVPKSSIYRHLRVLLEGAMVEIAETRPVKGTQEKFYRLAQSPHLSQADLAGFSPADHLRYFAVFLATQLQGFSSYLDAHPQPDLQTDRVGYTQAILSVSTEQLDRVLGLIQQAVSETAVQPPVEGSRPHNIAFITYPISPDNEKKDVHS